MKAIRISRPTQALVGANVGVGLVIALQLLFPAQPNAAFAATESENTAALPEFGDMNLSPPQMSQLVEMLDRPIFFVDRRMPVPPVETAPAPPPTPLRLKLEGIAIAGGARVAVLRNLNDNGLLQLAEGESHDGWTLDSISSTSASFSRGEQTTDLPLDPDAGGRRR